MIFYTTKTQLCFVYDRRRHKLPESVKRATIPCFFGTSTAADDHERSASAAAAAYEEIREPSSVTMSEPQSATPATGGNDLQTRAVPLPPIYAKPQKRSPAFSSAALDITDAGGQSSASGNNGPQTRAHPPTIYAKPNKRSAVSTSSANGQSSVYSGTSTTLIDNALYRTQQQPVTSSNVAEPGNYATIIDSDLYRREGQGQRVAIPRVFQTSAANYDDRAKTSAMASEYEEIKEPSSATTSKLQTTASAAGNNGLQQRASPPPIYAKPQKQKRSPASPSSVASGITDADGEYSGYSGRSTILMDNTLYETQQQPVTSSTVA